MLWVKNQNASQYSLDHVKYIMHRQPLQYRLKYTFEVDMTLMLKSNRNWLQITGI